MNRKLHSLGIFVFSALLTGTGAVYGQARRTPEICTQYSTRTQKGVLQTATKWKPGSTLKVSFIGGDAYVQGKVRKYAAEWSKHGNIKFAFVPAGQKANIRVAFVAGKGSKSLIGTDSQSSSINLETGLTYASKTGPSMNFGWFNATTSEENFRGTTLHEFGHAIGLLHEHQSPAGNISWNEERVYQDYWASDKWDRSQVYENIFKPYSKNQTQFTAYDRASIMHYPIPIEHVTNPAHAVAWNSTLSPKDIAFVSKIYAFPKPKPPKDSDGKRSPEPGGGIGPR